MTSETKDIIVQYIIESLNPRYGISEKCYDILQMLLKSDRDFAMELHETVNKLFCKNKTFFIEPSVEEAIKIYEEKNISNDIAESLLRRRELFLEKIATKTQGDLKEQLEEYEQLLQKSLLTPYEESEHHQEKIF